MASLTAGLPCLRSRDNVRTNIKLQGPEATELGETVT